MKKYIVYDDYKIGYIEHVCTCKKCKERGTYEVFINDLDNLHLDCIRGNEIENIIYLGDSLANAVHELVSNFKRKLKFKEKESEYLQELINFYSKLELK